MLSDDDPMLAGHGDDSRLDALVFSGYPLPVERVMVNGEWCVVDAMHVRRDRRARNLPKRLRRWEPCNECDKPRYQQLKDFIIDRFRVGAAAADRVPSENELVESKQRVANDGEPRAARVDRRGLCRTYCRPRHVCLRLSLASHLLEVQNIADEIAGRGHTHSSTVCASRCSTRAAKSRKALHVEQGTDVFHLLLVHYENGVPIQVEDRHVLASFAPDCLEQDFEAITPSAYLTGVAPLQEAEQSVRASDAECGVAHS